MKYKILQLLPPGDWWVRNYIDQGFAQDYPLIAWALCEVSYSQDGPSDPRYPAEQKVIGLILDTRSQENRMPNLADIVLKQGPGIPEGMRPGKSYGYWEYMYVQGTYGGG